MFGCGREEFDALACVVDTVRIACGADYPNVRAWGLCRWFVIIPNK